MKNKYSTILLLIAAIMMVFVMRTRLASNVTMPRTFEIFDILAVAGALFVLMKGHRSLRRQDVISALVLGLVIGVGMMFATLFSPYPFFGVVRSNAGQAGVRGILTFTAALGGLAIMRLGGPVQFHAANGSWREMSQGVLVGLTIGLPLAVVNVFALQFTQGRPVNWQSPIATLLDALQPGIVEEIIYRFVLWGLLWLVLRNSLPTQAAWLAGLLATLIHSFSHFDELFVQSPLMGLGMGALLTLLWGLPLLTLTRRRGLESALAFHWIQDVARFLAGF
ncbi:MAG: CPBP family intramembrane metalloprotease [Anaerolineales bacterium]|nr:CPBP family intramembrane metalloprotease [Anaerolineales bacterium]